MSEINLINLDKHFGDVRAVEKINVHVRDKEFLVLLGPSGCGKTTTLRMIAGLEEASGGDIYIGEKRVNNVHPKDRDIAMVFQSYALYPHMNVYQNMAFGLENRKVPKHEIATRVKKASSILGIDNLLDRKPKALSGGQRQRVAMGRAIVRDPKAFLFDEPLSNLDAKLRMVMRAELIKLHERLETTTVYVTHDQIEAMTLAHRIVLMKNGKIMQIGKPMDIYNRPANLFVAGFLGSPSINLFDIVIQRKNKSLYLENENFQLKIPSSIEFQLNKCKSKRLTLGIRPENFHDSRLRNESKDCARMKGVVDVIEPIGSQMILLCNCGTDSLTACIEPNTDLQVGSEIDFSIDMSRIHLFDSESGEAIFI